MSNGASISKSVQLASLSEAGLTNDAYLNGFISLRNVEPSLGLPSGITTANTPNSAYYFPLIGIDTDYGKSRAFTGDDSLVFKNNNLGINNPNPQFDIDINGSLNVISGANIQNLSASYLVPSSLSNTLSVNYPNGVIFNSPVYLYGSNNSIQSITATNLYVTNKLSAASAYFVNSYTTTISISNVIVSSALNVTGNLTALNIYVLSALYSPVISSNSFFSNTITANNLYVNNSINTSGSVYATNLHGKIDINPNSLLSYTGNQLTINTNTTYDFGVKPTDSYSTDDPTVQRFLNSSSYDSNITTKASDDNLYLPFFKTVAGAINYVKTNQIFGNELVIFVFEDTIEGENRPNNNNSIVNPSPTTPIDNSGNYSNCTYSGNLTGAFYSTEWLQTNATALYNSGIKGGDFFWSLDNSNPISGQVGYWNVDSTVNFKTVYIAGLNEFAKKYLSETIQDYMGEKPFNSAPPKLSFRTYFCNDKTLGFGNFGTQTSTSVYANWLALSAFPSVQNPYGVTRNVRPMGINSPYSTVNLRSLEFEFFSNALDSTALICYSGTMNLDNVTIDLFGNAVYAYGAVCGNLSNAFINLNQGTYQLDPYYLQNRTLWNNRGNNGIQVNSDPYYYPSYNFMVVGNGIDNTLPPTNLFNGFIRNMGGAYMNMWDYGASQRSYGVNSFLTCTPILDGKFNATSFINMEGAGLLSDWNYQIITGNNFALSSSQVNNTGNYDYNISNPLNFKYINFLGSYNNAAMLAPYSGKLYNWTFVIDGTYANSLVSVQYAPYSVFNGLHNQDSLENGAFDRSTTLLSLSASVYGNLGTNSILDYNFTSYFPDIASFHYQTTTPTVAQFLTDIKTPQGNQKYTFVGHKPSTR